VIVYVNLVRDTGVYQGDLVFLDTCSKNTIENDLINVPKFQKMASYILEITEYQKTPYNLEPVSEIQDYLRSITILSDDEAYRESLVCEPRGS
jgi:son of sevenless-like protein